MGKGPPTQVISDPQQTRRNEAAAEPFQGIGGKTRDNLAVDGIGPDALNALSQRSHAASLTSPSSTNVSRSLAGSAGRRLMFLSLADVLTAQR